jgi:putative zinc finger protein
MSPRRHVDALFTAAHDDDLSPIDEARFHAHIRSCKDCEAAFAEFTATVEALRELPRARMARVVHLPSTPPVAERSARPWMSLDWLNAGLLRRFPATAIAGAVAAGLIIFALVHNGGGIPAQTSTPSNFGSGSNAQPVAGAPGVNTQDSACTPAIASIAESSPPAGFSPARVATSTSLPGARLVLATSSLSVNAGQSVVVYAQLSLPVASLGIPGTTGVAPARRTVRPCVSVAIAGSGLKLSTQAGAAYAPLPDVASPQALHGPGTAPLLAFTVPPGLPPGTELNVVASIPAGFEGPGTPALTATLTLITH